MRVVKRMLLLLLCLTASVRCGTAQMATSDAVGPARSGVLVDVGGRRLHINCSGANAAGIGTEGYEVSERSVCVVPHDEDADARQESRHVVSAQQDLSM